MKRLLAVTAAACLFAAPFAFAQTQPAQTTPQATQPATPPANQPATPAPQPQAMPAQAAASDGDARCRTRKESGEQCSCLSAPTDFGTAAPAASGSHNMCVIGANPAAATAAAPSATPAPTPAPNATPAPTTPPAQQPTPTPQPN